MINMSTYTVNDMDANRTSVHVSASADVSASVAAEPAYAYEHCE